MSEGIEVVGVQIDAEEQSRLERQRAQRLETLSLTIKSLRDEAIKGREASGIEAQWLEDEWYYEGIDEANHHEHKVKPTSPDGRVTLTYKQRSGDQPVRSTVFVNLTRPYVDAASARVADMLLPTDDRNWDMRPTPIPDLINRTNDFRPAIDPATGQPITKQETDQNGQPVMKPRMMGDQPMVDANGQQMMEPSVIPVRVRDIAQQVIDSAKASAEKARTRIDDWHVGCSYHAEVRQVIESTAKIGVGILKGPFPKNVRRRAVVRAMERAGLIIKEE